MKKYRLLPHRSGFYFGDGDDRMVREIFYSKAGGVEILMNMFAEKKVDSANALELIKELARLPYLPIVERIAGDIDWLDKDFEALMAIRAAEHLFKQIEKTPKYSQLTVVLCAGCKKHANIIGPNIISSSFYSKEEGKLILEMMKEDEVIDLAEQLRLEKELAEINLPEKTPKVHNPLKEN